MRFLTAVLFSSLATTALAGDLAQRIDAAIGPMFKPDTPGAEVIVMRNGQPVFRKAYGLADLDRKIPLTPATPMRVGSVTKQFTAVAMLMLQDEGKLKISDPITRYLPDFPTHGKQITIEHLLTHTSGIANYANKAGFAEHAAQDATVDEMIASFKDDPLEFDPDTRWSYSNSGYFLAGAIIEKVSGMAYADFVEQRIFKPLKMASTTIEGHRRLPLTQARGYCAGEVSAAAAPSSMTRLYAAGALVTSADDLAKWDRAVSSGKLLSAQGWRQAFTRHRLADGSTIDSGLGWFMGSLQERPTISHAGMVSGARAYSLRLPEDHLYVAVLSNCESTLADPEVVANKAAAVAIGKPFPDYRPIALPAARFGDYLGIYSAGQDKRSIIDIDGQLYSQRGRQRPEKLVAYAPDAFLIDNTVTTLAFERDAAGKVSAIKAGRSGAFQHEPRAGDLPTTASAFPVPPALLDSYVGRYELQPGIVVTITRDGDTIAGQATGQPRFVLVAESEKLFVVRGVDARVRFERAPDTQQVRLVLLQSGAETPAARLP